MTTLALESNWELAWCAPDRFGQPPRGDELSFIPVPVRGTVARGLTAIGRELPGDLDAQDWWFRCRFSVADPKQGAALLFDGLATLARVWLNGEPILTSDNMFHRHRVDVSRAVHSENELVLCFSSLKSALAKKRPRPRWKTRLVKDQGLRWFRTALLGRMPEWCPEIAPVGPWRPVRLELGAKVWLEDKLMHTRCEGRGGRVHVRCIVGVTDVEKVTAGTLRVGDEKAALELTQVGRHRIAVEGEVAQAQVSRWWPHTHGAQPRTPVRLELAGSTLELGDVGFRDLTLDRQNFTVMINGVRLFARGACWTPLDVRSLEPSEADYRKALQAVREAGMNMLRLSGTFPPETDLFYRLCDELGILVWQDFAFSSLDYPGEDERLRASVELEAKQLLARLSASPSLAILCGNNEVSQQVAMLGLDRALWEHPMFEEVLSRVSRERRPDVPYWPSSPSGGVLPFHPNVGDAHYYGVGAFLRPISDARLSEVRFASECLAFSQLPSSWSPASEPVSQLKVPKDHGASWTFADVRDHYLKQLHQEDPARLRETDPRRYAELSQATVAEVMARTFAEWRRAGSPSHGGLVWYLRDLEPGAGLGILDAQGVPKSAWYALRRVLAPMALFATDEGLRGVWLHIANDFAHPYQGELHVHAYRDGDVQVLSAARWAEVAPRSVGSWCVDDLLGRFTDSAWAYRFGPPPYEMLRASYLGLRNELLAEAFFFPEGSAVKPLTNELTATLIPEPNGKWAVEVQSSAIARGVSLHVNGFQPSDDHFHLAPGGTRRIALEPLGPATTPKGYVTALNATAPIELSAPAPVTVKEGPDGRAATA